MRKSRLGASCAGLVAAALAIAAPAVELQDYIRKDEFNSLKLSPGGDYFAATVPLEDRTVLAIIRRNDRKVTGTFRMQKHIHVEDFIWVSPSRVVISVAERNGTLAEPQSTGEIFAIDADGSNADILKHNDDSYSWLVDDLPGDDRHVIVSTALYSTEPYTWTERMDVATGRSSRVARAPVPRARFVTDNRGVVRFAYGSGSDNARKLYYRVGENADWRLISDESETGRSEWPVGFSADDRTAYLQVEQPSGPDALYSFDIATGARKELLRDDDSDPWVIIYRNGTSIPVGVIFMDGAPRSAFFDDATPEARLYRSLEKAFEGQSIFVTSHSSDGRLALVQVWSDRNPGDFYLFDTVTKKAEYILSRASWFDPEEMAAMTPVSLVARDGLKLRGYLTVPRGSDGRGLPLLVTPHGGPFGVQDVWGFDGDVQMLAEAGYAVLQVNYRGSGGYGSAFAEAGARQWGGTMQDDLTDATRWAVQQGIADPERICLYGGSYGAYASLMGVAKEPDLYRCAAGYAGVYDLPMMQSHDARGSRRYGNWSEEWVGERADLGTVSPNRLADRIKVPVFLAAGEEDYIAPVAHSRMMEKALRKAGGSVESLYFAKEGHGFYLEKNRLEYYKRLLAFFSRHLGGKPAGVASDRDLAAGTASK